MLLPGTSPPPKLGAGGGDASWVGSVDRFWARASLSPSPAPRDSPSVSSTGGAEACDGCHTWGPRARHLGCVGEPGGGAGAPQAGARPPLHPARFRPEGAAGTRAALALGGCVPSPGASLESGLVCPAVQQAGLCCQRPPTPGLPLECWGRARVLQPPARGRAWRAPGKAGSAVTSHQGLRAWVTQGRRQWALGLSAATFLH